MERHVLMRNSIFFANVCSAGTYDEALKWIRENNPAGTTNNWGKADESNPSEMPCECADDPERTHYMFLC